MLPIKCHWYTSQLKYVFRLEENVSRIVGQNSLTSWGKNNMDFRLLLFETAANLWASRHKANDFFTVFFIFQLGCITKHLITGPTGNSQFCFPSTSMFASGNIKSLVACEQANSTSASGVSASAKWSGVAARREGASSRQIAFAARAHVSKVSRFAG